MLHVARAACFAALAGLSLAAGCSSSSSPDNPASTNPDNIPGAGLGPCEARSGSYLVHEVERPGGSCGPVADQTVTIEAGGALDIPGCTGADTPTSDLCKETLGLTCSATGHDGPRTFTSAGTITWSVNGLHGTELAQVGGACASQYDVSFTKQ